MGTNESELYPIGKSQETKDAIANLVFVHGLGGDYKETWQSDKKDPKTLWPEWLFDDLNENVSKGSPPVNVWSLSYPAEAFRVLFFSKAREDSVPQRARNLISILVTAGIADRPILFVTHSLGGIMVKQMLRSSVDARHQKGDFVKLGLGTRLVLFLATPHAGAAMANLARHIITVKDMVVGGLVSTVDWLPMGPAWLPGAAIKALARKAVRRGPFTAALEWGDPYLEDLSLWYRDNSRELGIETKSYCENAAVKGAAVVVDKVSANPGVGEVIPVDADHFTICKPGGRNAVYKLFAAAVRDTVKRCPVFRETHLAVFDVGRRFEALTELHPEERTIATKKVIQPIECRLGRTKPVEYDTSFAGSGAFNVAKWQETSAPSSPYDLDRIILYVWYQYQGIPFAERILFLKQERERLVDPKNLSLIPLYYAARMLLTQKGKADLNQDEKAEVKSILDFVQKLADKSEMDADRRTRDKLEALLK
jgi:hypothetical protein